MAWILQGNPDQFDVDYYLSHYHFVYWSAPTHQKDFSVGDRVFFWRSSGKTKSVAGVIAIGTIEELPIMRKAVKQPLAMGTDFWRKEPRDEMETVIGVKIDDIRPSPEDGMIQRAYLESNPIFQNNRIITFRQGTVFGLTSQEAGVLEEKWGSVSGVDSFTSDFYASEGRQQLQTHYRRERSRKLIAVKKEQFKHQYRKLYCEICGFSFGENYPPNLGADFIEVHHKVPLSQIDESVKTTLDDLLLVCSNCHRMIHRTADCDQNLQTLVAHFSKKN